MNRIAFIFCLFLTGCTPPPVSAFRFPLSALSADPRPSILALNKTLGGSAPREIFSAGGNAEPETVLPQMQLCLAGDLDAESSNCGLWQVWAAGSPEGPFIQQSPLLTTNHFEIPMTNTAQFFLFYGLNN